MARFLAGEIRYTDIPRILERALASAGHLPCATADDVLSAAEIGRRLAMGGHSPS